MTDFGDGVGEGVCVGSVPDGVGDRVGVIVGCVPDGLGEGVGVKVVGGVGVGVTVAEGLGDIVGGGLKLPRAPANPLPADASVQVEL